MRVKAQSTDIFLYLLSPLLLKMAFTSFGSRFTFTTHSLEEQQTSLEERDTEAATARAEPRHEGELIPKRGGVSVVWPHVGYKKSDINHKTPLCKLEQTNTSVCQFFSVFQIYQSRHVCPMKSANIKSFLRLEKMLGLVF